MKQSGWLELICGSMFSGKSEELIRRVKRATYAKQEVRVFKPVIDNRYSEAAVVSHNGTSMTSYAISSAADIWDHISESTDAREHAAANQLKPPALFHYVHRLRSPLSASCVLDNIKNRQDCCLPVEKSIIT